MKKRFASIRQLLPIFACCSLVLSTGCLAASEGDVDDERVLADVAAMTTEEVGDPILVPKSENDDSTRTSSRSDESLHDHERTRDERVIDEIGPIGPGPVTDMEEDLFELNGG